MKGDFTRTTFRPTRHYQGVYTQQGRVRLDADSNEQVDIGLHRARATAADVVGLTGIPRTSPGFLIAPSADGKDLGVSAGHIYVDGILCENDDATTYLTQKDYPNPDPDVALQAGHSYAVYLDVWTRGISALEDPDIREKALGGPDTTTRSKTVWQVKLIADGSYDPAQFASTGQMSAKSAGPGAAAPCTMPSAGGYSGLENQLYRVEIHRPSAAGKPTMKWSRDNASVGASIVARAGETFWVKQLGPDVALGLSHGQWVELLNDDLVLHGQPGFLGQVQNPDAAACTLSLAPQPPAGVTYTRMIRWDQNGNDAGAQAIELTYDWQTLECGVQVKFAKGHYLSGDYWLIPARSGTRDIEWPAPAVHPPDGIKHHYCRLATVAYDGTKFTLQGGPQTTFPPLTAITAADVSYDSHACPPISPLSGQKTVQAALDALSKLDASDIPFDNSKAKLDDATTVQQAIDELSQHEGCFTLTANPGAGLAAVLAQIPADVRDAHICLRPGKYTLATPCKVDGGAKPTEPRGRLRITGCGPAANLVADCRAALWLRYWQSVTIEGVAIEGGALQPYKGDLTVVQQLWGALTFDDCTEVSLRDVTVKCAAGPARSSACVKVNNAAGSGTSTRLRIEACGIYPGNRQIGVLAVDTMRCHIADNVFGASGAAVSATPLPDDSAARRRLRDDLVSNGVYGSVAPGSGATLSFHGQTVRFITPAELAKAWQPLLDALKLKPNLNAKALRMSVANMPAIVLNALKTDAAPPPVLAAFKTWLAKQPRDLLAGLQRGDARVMAKLGGMLMTRVSTAPARTPAAGRAAATVTYQSAAGKTYSVTFETAAGLQNEWQSLVAAEKPKVASASALLRYITGRAASLVAGDAALLGRAAFAGWRAQYARLTSATAAQSIVVAGSRARDVRILNNTIEQTLEAISVALSHDRKKDVPRGRRNRPDLVERLQIAGNSIWLQVSSQTAPGCRALFVGNCQSLLVENNYLNVRRDSGITFKVEGIRLFGFFGPLVVVRQNHVTDCIPAFSMRGLAPVPAQRQWLIENNFPA